MNNTALLDLSETLIYSTSNTMQRDALIKQIYNSIIANPDLSFTVEQDQINRIRVYHNVNRATKILIRTYLVVIIPVCVDESPLIEVCFGQVHFDLQETIDELNRHITILKSIQKLHMLEGNDNGETLRSLVKSLCGTDGEYRTS